MKRVLVLGAIAIGLAACASESVAEPRGDVLPDSILPTLGQICTGSCAPGEKCSLAGCAVGQLCNFKNDACGIGVCAVDVRGSIRSYCSIECATGACPQGFECSTPIFGPRLCVATRPSTCGDHVEDKGEGCDTRGSDTNECSASCELAPPTIRVVSFEAESTATTETYRMKAVVPRVPLPYRAAEAPEGVIGAFVEHGDHGAAKVRLVIRQAGEAGGTLTSVVELLIARKTGTIDAKDVLLPYAEDDGRGLPGDVKGSFDVKLSGRRTYLVDFDFKRSVYRTDLQSAEYGSFKGSLEIIAPP